MSKQAGLAVVTLGVLLAMGCSGEEGSSTSTAASRSGAGDRDHDRDGDRKVFEFEGMVGVPRALLGAAGAIRGVNGAGAPWVITRGKGELHGDGTLEIDARGVVFDPADPANIAAGRANANTVPIMRGVLSCLTVVNGAQQEVNLLTDPFPATTGLVSDGGGDVHIEQKLPIPSPCFAPIVFVTNNAGSWFAVTGYTLAPPAAP